MKRIIFLSVALFVAHAAMAQAEVKPSVAAASAQSVVLQSADALSTVQPKCGKCQRPPFSQQHELRASIGYVPMFAYLGSYFVDGMPPPSYISPTFRGPLYTTGAVSVSYGYRFYRWLDVGMVVSYYNEFHRLYDSFTNDYLGRVYNHHITLMPTVRFTWLDRKWVRMYSSLAAGATFYTQSQTKVKGEAHYNSQNFAGHFTYLGITVGRSFFGFAELGIGAKGFATMGLGYKFNNPTKAH